MPNKPTALTYRDHLGRVRPPEVFDGDCPFLTREQIDAKYSAEGLARFAVTEARIAAIAAAARSAKSRRPT